MEYEFDAIPTDDLPKLPEATEELALEEFVKLFLDANPADTAVRAGFIYDRKSYVNVDKLGGPRNKSYGHNSDDVVIQVTLRVSSRLVAPLILQAQNDQEELDEVVRALAIAEKERARDALDAQIAELQAQRKAM